MAGVRRGEGRAAMIQAAADSLLAGREVKVRDIAEKAGVRHTLIYRHFPEGGRDELAAEAYAQLFLGQSAEDMQIIRSLSSDPARARTQLRDKYLEIMSADRDSIRWARFEALAKARSNPYIAARLETTREQLIAEAVEILLGIDDWSMSPADTRTLAVLILGMPLGVSPMLGPEATAAERDSVANMWADVVAGWLTTH